MYSPEAEFPLTEAQAAIESGVWEFIATNEQTDDNVYWNRETGEIFYSDSRRQRYYIRRKIV